MNFRSILPMLMALCVCLGSCAGKNELPPSPVPEKEVGVEVDEAVLVGRITPDDATIETQAAEETAGRQIRADAAFTPRKGEPGELTELLEMKGKTSKGQSAVSQIRPAAIREAAQLATFQKAMAWRYGQLLSETEQYQNIMDTAFNFSPLLLTQGEALIMPPLLAKGGASMRIEDGETATSAKTTYELLEPARYIAAAPTWREFLMVDSFPQAEDPNPALLPLNSAERAIWREAVREAWAEGVAQADQLYADNVARMTREYRGVMLYHLLTAQHLLSQIGTASADLGRHASSNGEKLNIGQKVYRITRPSAFVLNPGKKGQKR